MEPNFNNGQYLVINEIGYRFQNPQRGEVIVFRYPLDPSQYYIKRIIGLPNETIELQSGQITVYNSEFPEGVVLDETSYLPSDAITVQNFQVKLGPEEYFVMGDNRKFSSDSRQWGPLTEDNIIGRVWLRAWPFNQAKVF